MLYQRHGGLFTNAGHTGNIVTAVAGQSLQVDHVDGVKAVLRPESGFGHAAVAVRSLAAGQQTHMGVGGDQLQAVAVAGGDGAVPADGLALAADGTDQVIGLVAGQLIAGHGHGVEHLLQRQHLFGQLLGHTLAVGLIGRVGLVPECWLPPVKGSAHGVRLLLVQQLLQHGDKAVNGVCVQPLPCGQQARLSDAVIGAVDDTVAVENHQFHR